MSKKIYKGLEIMDKISKGQIADRTRINFENNNFDGVVEYYNGVLYWIFFDEKGKEEGRKNLFDMFNIQSTMVADFELIEDNTIDINYIQEVDMSIKEYQRNEVINKLVQAVKQLNKEIKSIKEK